MPPLYGRAASLSCGSMDQTLEKPNGRSREPAGGAWRVIVCNDDHNTFDHVARTLARFIPGITLSRGTRSRT